MAGHMESQYGNGGAIVTIIPDALYYRDDITPSQKWLLAVLLNKATTDGVLSITRYSRENSCHLQGADVASDLTALTLAKDVALCITKTSQGECYDLQVRTAVLA